MEKKLKRIKLRFLVYLFVSVVLAGFVGYLFGNQNIQIYRYGVKFANNNLGKPDDVDFELFWQAYQKIKADYIGEVDLNKYLYGSIAGGFASVDDPYTNFLSPDISDGFRDELDGQLEGIGIRVGVYEGRPAVIAPLNDSPAQKAGLKPKDKIMKIDDKDTDGMVIDQAVELMRGKAGTTVKLEVLRSGEENTKMFEIIRDKIDVKTVESKKIDDVGVIEITEFGTETTADFLKIAESFKKDGVIKIVLDLRNNPGGLLDSAVRISGELLEKGKAAVIEQSRDGEKISKADGNESLKDAKIVVLVNGGCASAAEILAGAIKDNNRGKIIGEKTFGKGTVQELVGLPGGSSVKITVAKWLTPSGVSIDKNGITPDIEIKEPDDILFLKDDPLIQKAIDELK